MCLGDGRSHTDSAADDREAIINSNENHVCVIGEEFNLKKRKKRCYFLSFSLSLPPSLSFSLSLSLSLPLSLPLPLYFSLSPTYMHVHIHAYLHKWHGNYMVTHPYKKSPALLVSSVCVYICICVCECVSV